MAEGLKQEGSEEIIDSEYEKSIWTVKALEFELAMFEKNILNQEKNLQVKQEALHKAQIGFGDALTSLEELKEVRDKIEAIIKKKGSQDYEI